MADILIRKNARYENRMVNKDRIEWFILTTLFLQLRLASIKLIEKNQNNNDNNNEWKARTSQ